jgi:hypothetical protein
MEATIAPCWLSFVKDDFLSLNAILLASSRLAAADNDLLLFLRPNDLRPFPGQRLPGSERELNRTSMQ